MPCMHGSSSGVPLSRPATLLLNPQLRKNTERASGHESVSRRSHPDLVAQRMQSALTCLAGDRGGDRCRVAAIDLGDGRDVIARDAYDRCSRRWPQNLNQLASCPLNAFCQLEIAKNQDPDCYLELTLCFSCASSTRASFSSSIASHFRKPATAMRRASPVRARPMP